MTLLSGIFAFHSILMCLVGLYLEHHAEQSRRAGERAEAMIGRGFAGFFLLVGLGLAWLAGAVGV